jgi:hypothetical protein
MIKAGETSARRPDVSFRFMQPDNLPEGDPARERPTIGRN